MRPEVVRFSSHPRPFRVEIIRCANLECGCTEVAFNFRERVKRSRAAVEGMAFQVLMNGQTWEEIDPPTRPPAIARLVQEFLHDYPPGDRESIQRLTEEKGQIARRLRDYRIDPKWIEDGTLVPFGAILYDRTSGKADSASFLDRFRHAGEGYLVDDLYCPNPECHCDAVHLAFVRRVPSGERGGGVAAESQFLARLSFDGRAEIVERHFGTPSEAEAILSTWQKRYGNDLEELRWRYEKVKEIARRSIPRQTIVAPRTNPLPARESPAAKVRIGRNEPCPCGSGKKFKKCCGQYKGTR